MSRPVQTQSRREEIISSVGAREDVVVDGGEIHAFESDSDTRRLRPGAFFGSPVIAGNRVFGRRTEDEFVDTTATVDLATGETVASHTFD